MQVISAVVAVSAFEKDVENTRHTDLHKFWSGHEVTYTNKFMQHVFEGWLIGKGYRIYTKEEVLENITNSIKVWVTEYITRNKGHIAGLEESIIDLAKEITKVQPVCQQCLYKKQ